MCAQFLVRRTEFDIWPLQKASVMSEVSAWLRIPQKTMVTITTEVIWGFPADTFLQAEASLGLHVKCPLLWTNFNKIWNV
jgi:hypothetical protein